MVEGFAPESAVEFVELVVVGADVPGGDGFGGWEHVQGVTGGYGNSENLDEGFAAALRLRVVALNGIAYLGLGVYPVALEIEDRGPERHLVETVDCVDTVEHSRDPSSVDRMQCPD